MKMKMMELLEKIKKIIGIKKKEDIKKIIGIKTINLCIRASKLVYFSEFVLPGVKETPEMKKFNDEGTNGFIADVNDDVLIIAFRGSDEIRDYVRGNLLFTLKKLPYHENPFSPILVHEGFGTLYANIRDEVHELIESRVVIHKKIIVTGHSLGGALATLCALDLQYSFPDMEIFCVTLGSPRVGNIDFANSYNNRVPKTIRIVNGNDIVARMPLWLSGYRHVSKRFQVGSRKKLWNFLLGSVRDHSAYEQI